MPKVRIRKIKTTTMPRAKRRRNGQKTCGPRGFQDTPATAVRTRPPSGPQKGDARLAWQLAANDQADGEQGKAHQGQAGGDQFQTLHGGQQRQQGAQFVGLQVMLLPEKHDRRHGRQGKGAIGLQDGRRVQAAKRVAKLGVWARGAGPARASRQTPRR